MSELPEIGNKVVVGLDEWSRLMWAIRDTGDERVKQAWEQAVQSAVVPSATNQGDTL